MSLRVAFDMTPTIGTRTGIGNVVAHLFESLRSSESVELVPYTLSYKARSFSDELPENNIFVPYPARILLSAWKYSQLFSLDKSLAHVDIIHATNYLSPPTHHPLLITVHDVTMVKYPELVPPHVRSFAPMIRKRIESGAHIQVPAVAIKEDVLEFFDVNPDRVHVIPFSTPDLINKNPSERTKQLALGDPYILSIGALEPRKNHARLIEAFRTVFEKNPHVRLFLVGPDGPARPAIDAAMAELNRDTREHVVITGKVSDADRSYLLRNALMVAYPSLYEGFGLPVLEAMTAHVPIVTTKEGSLEEVGGEAAYFVDAHDTNDIARGILEVLESKEIRDKLIHAGQQRILDFSWEKSATQLADLYTHIITSQESQDI